MSGFKGGLMNHDISELLVRKDISVGRENEERMESRI